MLFILRKVWALLLTPVLLLTGASLLVMDLAGEDAIAATRWDYVYDNDRLLLGAYCYDPAFSDPAYIGQVKDAGLDFLICDTTPAFMDECGRQGVGVIASHYNAPAMYGDVSDGGKAQWMNLSAEGYQKHPALWGDNVIDEPSARSFRAISDILGHYYALDTGRLPMINLFPIYADSDQLGNEPQLGSLRYLLPGTAYADESLDKYRRHTADYIKTIDTDYISVDIYPYGLDGTNDAWLHNLDILAEACRGTGRDLWVITQAAGNEVDEGGGMRWCSTKPDQLQQSYASLAFGAKAVVYACYQTGWWDDGSHMVNAAGETTDTYDAVRAVNEELRVFAETYGEYSWLGAYTVNSYKAAGLRYELANGLPKQERLRLNSWDGLLVGCFDQKDGDGKAYVIVNMMELLHEKTARLTVEFPENTPVTLYVGGIPTAFEGGRREIMLAPGEGVFVTVG